MKKKTHKKNNYNFLVQSRTSKCNFLFIITIAIKKHKLHKINKNKNNTGVI